MLNTNSRIEIMTYDRLLNMVRAGLTGWREVTVRSHASLLKNPPAPCRMNADKRSERKEGTKIPDGSMASIVIGNDGYPYTVDPTQEWDEEKMFIRWPKDVIDKLADEHDDCCDHAGRDRCENLRATLRSIQEFGPEAAAPDVAFGKLVLPLAGPPGLLARGDDQRQQRGSGVCPRDADSLDVHKVETCCSGLIQPRHRFNMLWARFGNDPDGRVRLDRRELGYELAEVVVVARFKLVLNNDRVARIVLRDEIDGEIASLPFPLRTDERQVEDLVQHVDVLLEPSREVQFVFPDLTERYAFEFADHWTHPWG